MAQVIAISNQKGGVAKTSSCMSLGACLAELARRTLVVDLDPQAHLTLAAGCRSDDLEWSVVDLLGREPVSPLPTRQPGLDLLPADLRLAPLEHSLYTLPGYETRLVEALSPLQTRYDYILLDCPPSLGALTLMALTAAQFACIPVQCEYFSTHGVIQLLDVIQAVRQRTNPALQYALFVTLFDGRNLVARSVLAQLQNHFQGKLLETIVQVDTRLRECAIAGEPVTLYAPKTRASRQYRSLAAELVRRLEGQGEYVEP